MTLTLEAIRAIETRGVTATPSIAPEDWKELMTLAKLGFKVSKGVAELMEDELRDLEEIGRAHGS